MNEKDDFVLEAILKATPYHDKDSKTSRKISGKYPQKILIPDFSKIFEFLKRIVKSTQKANYRGRI